jgi:formylglycine-generating enzyme required for sulfatase activity/predicted Ser/Thr protein kinase
MELQPNTTLQSGKITIIKKIGQGGFGITYLAEHGLYGKIALKEFFLSTANKYCTRSGKTVSTGNMNSTDFAKFKQDFINEAKTLYQLKDIPNVVNVHDYFEENNTVYFFMDYIEGESLKILVERKNRLPLNTAITYIEQIGNALIKVHEKGILHRDVKPDNILINTRNNAILIDFGIARNFVEGEAKTHTGMATKGYAPPEQFVQKAKRGAYTDVFSLGGTLYFCLTGKRPQTSDEINLDGFLTPKDLNKNIPNNINTAILKAIEKNPKNRYQSVQAFLKGITENVTSQEEEERTIIEPPSFGEESQIEQTIIDSTSTQKEQQQEKKSSWFGTLKKTLGFNHNEIQESINIEMVEIPSGTFQMGSNENDDEKPIHRVTLNGFKMSKYPITQKQWRGIMGRNPSYFKNCDNCPVENVSWNDTQKFIKKLNQKTGENYRLPTEAEWEYAAKGGQNYKYAGSNNIGSVAWYNGNSGSKTHPVGQKSANGYGLHDMSGNVWEWCQDVWHDNYSGAPTYGSAWISGGNSAARVLRGGSWYSYSESCRAANRISYTPSYRFNTSGFRLVLP